MCLLDLLIYTLLILISMLQASSSFSWLQFLPPTVYPSHLMRSDYITLQLKNLQWLPITNRIVFSQIWFQPSLKSFYFYTHILYFATSACWNLPHAMAITGICWWKARSTFCEFRNLNPLLKIGRGRDGYLDKWQVKEALHMASVSHPHICILKLTN